MKILRNSKVVYRLTYKFKDVTEYVTVSEYVTLLASLVLQFFFAFELVQLKY